MAISRNLLKGQYQLGDLVMGPFTPFRIDNVEIGNYDVNMTDWQAQSSNEIRYGSESLKPSPIQLQIAVLVNRIHPRVAAITGDSRQLKFSEDPNLSDLQREWRAVETLSTPNALKPLLFCGTDGIVRQYYGRPGKFTYKKPKQVGSEYYAVTAEYRRSDTFAYSDIEYFIPTSNNGSFTLPGTVGTAPSWVRFLLYGPMTNPIINFGSKQIQIGTGVQPISLTASQAIEISSYPWQRRVVRNDGISLASYIVSDKPYLDQIQLPNDSPTLISWHADGTTANSKMVFLWRNGYQVMD